MEIFGWICPLTPLENHFRLLAGNSSYNGDFIAQYLLPVIYPENLTSTMQQVFGWLSHNYKYNLLRHRHPKMSIPASTKPEQ